MTDVLLASRVRDAQRYIEASSFTWFQRFELAPGVWTPGKHDAAWVLNKMEFPVQLQGQSVLDIGTANGAVAFEAERRGASRVLAIDILPDRAFGPRQTGAFLGSQVEFREGSIYELPSLVNGERFNLVCFFGVLYHLRHPLLALDAIRAVCRNGATMLLETLVADAGLPPEVRDLPIAQFLRLRELADTPTNWWAPTIYTVLQWCHSCGFDPSLIAAWPEEAPERCGVRASVVPGLPEYLRISHERPVHASVNAWRPVREIMNDYLPDDATTR